MVTNSVETIIRRVPMFAQLPPPQFAAIRGAFEERRYRAGEVIFRQGERTRGLYVFTDGQAVLHQTMPDGNRRSIGSVGGGQFINQNALTREGVESATLQAVQNLTVLVLTREALANLITYQPALGRTLGLGDQPQQESAHLHQIRFKGQRENEQVLLMTRRHWWAYMRWMWVPLLLMVGLWVLAASVPELAFVLLPVSVIVGGICAVWLYMEWANDSVIISDQRVMRIMRTILTFTEVRDEISLESIQEANADIPGMDPFALFFRYGVVEIRTAGREGNFTLDFMPEPDDIQQLIMEDLQERTVSTESRNREAMRAELARWLDPAQAQAQASATSGTNTPQSTEWTPDRAPFSPFQSRFPVVGGGVVFRTHWFVWARRIVPPVLVMLAALTFMVLIMVVTALQPLGIIGWAGALLAFLIGAIWFYFVDWDWRHDYVLVTDSSITIIHQRPLWLQNENDQVLLRQVDNVVSETSGIWQRLFNYGNVKIALVGADEHKTFRNVPHPRDIQNEISRRQAASRQRDQHVNQNQQREVIADYLRLYHETYGQAAIPNMTMANERGNPQAQSSNPASMSPGRPYQPGNPPTMGNIPSDHPSNRLPPQRPRRP